MDLKTALIEKLQQHPELNYSEGADWVRIEPASTTAFAVELRSYAEEATVILGNAGFHESFTSTQETLEFIA